jgi:hypothetical protein
VLTDAAVVKDGRLLTGIRVAMVWDALRILRTGETDPRMRPVAKRFALRFAAPAQRHLRSGRQFVAKPAPHILSVRHEVRPVGGNLNTGRNGRLQIPKLGQPAGYISGGRELAGQVLQCGGRLDQAERCVRGCPEPGCCLRYRPQLLGEGFTRTYVRRRLGVRRVGVIGAGRDGIGQRAQRAVDQPRQGSGFDTGRCGRHRKCVDVREQARQRVRRRVPPSEAPGRFHQLVGASH